MHTLSAISDSNAARWNRRFIVAVLGLVLANPTTLSGEETDVLPGDEKRKIVMVDGWSKVEAQKITLDFATTYKQEIAASAELEVEVRDDEVIVLTFPAELSAETFYYLINYFHYPYDFDLEGRKISVLGIADVDTTFNVAPKGLTFFYVPADDEEFDTIYAQVHDGSGFQIPFYHELKFMPPRWTAFNWTHVDNLRQSEGIKELIAAVTTREQMPAPSK